MADNPMKPSGSEIKSEMDEKPDVESENPSAVEGNGVSGGDGVDGDFLHFLIYQIFRKLLMWPLKRSLACISEVAEAYLTAIKDVAAADSAEVLPQKSIQEKANAFTEHLRADRTTAVGKMQDGLQYLTYLVISTSMPCV
ncbi:hypothetical protein OROMI_031564 [Orobanche minor]